MLRSTSKHNLGRGSQAENAAEELSDCEVNYNVTSDAAPLQLFSPAKVSANDLFAAWQCCEQHGVLQINLFLRVMRRREDGYHDLASLFHVRLICLRQATTAAAVLLITCYVLQVIDLGDTMHFTLLSAHHHADQLECNVPDIPVDGTNLVIRVCKLPTFRHLLCDVEQCDCMVNP